MFAYLDLMLKEFVNESDAENIIYIRGNGGWGGARQCRHYLTGN
jgi:enoyl reductase-like protein